MRLTEQREALVSSSRTPSQPSSRNDEPPEAHFPTDEDTLAESLERTGVPDPEDEPVWLVGNHCSIADLSFVTWANVVDRIGIDLDTEFPVLPFLMKN